MLFIQIGFDWSWHFILVVVQELRLPVALLSLLSSGAVCLYGFIGVKQVSFKGETFLFSIVFVTWSCIMPDAFVNCLSFELK